MVTLFFWIISIFDTLSLRVRGTTFNNPKPVELGSGDRVRLKARVLLGFILVFLLVSTNIVKSSWEMYHPTEIYPWMSLHRKTSVLIDEGFACVRCSSLVLPTTGCWLRSTF